MTAQLDIFSSLPSEDWVYSLLQPELMDVVTLNQANSKKLCLKTGKNYSSVWYDTQMVFRICCREKRCYFGIPLVFLNYIPTDLLKFETAAGNSSGFINLEFTATTEGIKVFSSTLAAIIEQSIYLLPKEFDCCSRYNECSDAKKCIQPNPDLAVHCGYRKILKSGKIYYGKNRNV